MKALVAVLAASCAFTAAAAAAGPAQKPTSAGATAAKQSLLLATDLKDWKASAATSSGFALSCKGFTPSGAGIVQTGAAMSQSFALSNVGPFIYQSTGVFQTPAQARLLWTRAVQPGLIACIVQTVSSIANSGQGVKVTISSKGPLTIQKKATSLETAYRVLAVLHSSKVKYTRKLYFDVFLVSKGGTVSEITYSSLLTPVPSNVEEALAALVVHRIGLPTA